MASKTQWYRNDTKDGVTVSRCKFGRSRQHHAVIKVDGTIPHHPDTVAQFLQLSMRPGGKLDYLFRNETLVDHINGVCPPLLLECIRFWSLVLVLVLLLSGRCSGSYVAQGVSWVI